MDANSTENALSVASLLADIEMLRERLQKCEQENATLLGFADDRKAFDSLSERERQILVRIGAGSTTKEIAMELHLSASTIETYRERIKHKLELKSAPQLVRFAILHCLQRPSEQ